MESTRNGVHWRSLRFLRRLYDWVLGWADSRWSSTALFVLAFVESSFFIIPPDTLLIALGVSKPRKAPLYGAITTLGSVLGGVFGYLIGSWLFLSLGQAIIDFFSLQVQFEMVGRFLQDNAFMTIFGAAFTPIPYKVFTIASGFWSVSILTFIGASALGRGIRFGIESALIYFLGERIARFIDRFFNLITILAFLLVIAVYFLIRYLH